MHKFDLIEGALTIAIISRCESPNMALTERHIKCYLTWCTKILQLSL